MIIEKGAKAYFGVRRAMENKAVCYYCGTIYDEEQGKCPLCGSRMIGGTCNECGYSVPDETEISSMYNYDPDDDEFGEKSEYPSAEEYNAQPYVGVRHEPMQREEVDRTHREAHELRKAPHISVVKQNDMQVYTPNQNAPQQNNNASPYANNNASPYANNNANPYANFSPVNNSSGSGNVNDPSFTRDMVIGIILGMLIPIVGIFYGIKFMNKYKLTNDKRYLTAGIVVLALSVLNIFI